MFVLLMLLSACGVGTTSAVEPSAVEAEVDPTAVVSDLDQPVTTTPTVPAAKSPVPATPIPKPTTLVPPTEPAAAPTEPAAAPTATAQEAEPVVPTPNESPDAEPTIATEPDCIRLTDFAAEAENFAWFVVNDGVMGGRSSGGPSFEDRSMVFEGAINTNGGGFSSVRTPLAPGAFAGFTHLKVRARTDGRLYKITLEDGLETRDSRVSQQAALVFETAVVDGWQIGEVSFADLTPRIFGRDVASAAFRPDLADQLGVMLSDGVDGAFRIEIDWIDVCR